MQMSGGVALEREIKFYVKAKKKNNSLNACCKYIFSRAKEDELDFDEYEEFLLYTRDIILKPRIKREEGGLNESD